MKKKVTDQDIISALNEIIRETNKPQKVELGLVDDLVKDAKTLSTKYEKAVKNHMAIAKLVNENFKEMSSLVKAAKKGYGFVSTIDKQFKELGVKPSKQYKKASQEIFDIAEGSGEQMLKDLAKFKGLL
tara:strand:- start:322 stop:708 length:387 start_codon:yes stop_codon:yes gene_type:complete